ncbi:MAG: alpha/beta hydrolase [Cyclobacteriaceae bacterium]|nr:alpha/beta hydrolase [Cyclobacteriaceae bacterium]
MKQSNFESYLNSTNVRITNPMINIINKALILGQWIYPKGVESFVRRKFFTPSIKPISLGQSRWIKKARPIKIESRARSIQLWKMGEGPSILFVHGWNGRGVQFQHFFQPALDAGFSIIFFDAPAHGLSEGEMTNYLEITESLQGIFNHEIGKDIVGVIAHSLGSSAIINHISRHHNQVTLVLIAPALRLMELLFASFKMHGVPKKTYIKLVREVEEQFQIPLETQNPIDLIYHVNNNILIIHDKNDNTTPIKPAIQVAEDLDNVELIITEGYGHSQLLKQKIVVEKAIIFMKSENYSTQNKVEVNEGAV